MTLEQLLEQLNQFAKEYPDLLRTEVYYSDNMNSLSRYYIRGASLQKDFSKKKNPIVELSCFRKESFHNTK